MTDLLTGSDSWAMSRAFSCTWRTPRLRFFRSGMDIVFTEMNRTASGLLIVSPIRAARGRHRTQYILDIDTLGLVKVGKRVK